MSIFTEIRGKRPRANTFRLDHSKKFTGKFGKLMPMLCIECVPGDSFRISTAQMVRFAPLVSPVMHEVSSYMHFFKVPVRILWDNWPDFITGGEDGADVSVFPTLQIDTVNESSLEDYLGLPTNQEGGGTEAVSAVPFAAYQAIWNEYYRDQNLQVEVDYKLNDGDNPAGALRILRNRAWQHDYFTSALPFTQKGPEATIPLGTEANVMFDLNRSSSPSRAWTTDGSNQNAGNPDMKAYISVPRPDATVQVDQGGSVFKSVAIDNSSQLYADLSTATAAGINDLRRAFRLQEWLEKNARGGSRYIESIMSHFGVKSSDARLQRPEFLGGFATPMSISEVLQTSSSDATTPQANMAGHGIGVGQGSRIKTYCEEHCYIIGIMSIMPKTGYSQGIPKHFLKFDKFDYFWPSFAHIGEQEILNKEIYMASVDNANDDTFGYTPRYAEYKYLNDTIAGQFKGSLDFWTIARKFENRPALNGSFIECNDATDGINRIFAVPDNAVDKFYITIYHKISAKRLMPYFGNPNI